MKIKESTGSINRYIHELLLYSGQFALFYLLMQFIIEGHGFIKNYGHVGILIALIIQTAILMYWGDRVKIRVFATFLVPLVYSLFEIREGIASVFNAAHIGFWIYAGISSLLMTIKIKGNNKNSKISEITLVIVNVTIFIFLYFYFDTWRAFGEKSQLTVYVIFDHLPLFFNDPTHWFVLFGGYFLAITVALGRMEVAALRDKIYSLFGKYVDRKVRDIIIQEGKVEAKRIKLCVLFSDIKDFTGLCEKHDPESITKMLNHYFEQWNILVEKYNGIVDKYIGDAIMVVFGIADTDEACNQAVMCGIEMRNQWKQIQKNLSNENLPVPSDFGIGCHYGDLIFGDIGSSDRKNFSVIGDTVNIASRLEAVSRTINSKLLISSEVYIKLSQSNSDEFSKIGLLDLKGKQEATETWGYESKSQE